MTTPVVPETAQVDDWVSVERYHRSGDRDDTASFARALEAHARVLVPPRARPYVVRAPDVNREVDLRYGVLVPGGRKLRGMGRDSVIRTILPDASNLRGAEEPANRNVVSFFVTDWGARDIEFSDLLFVGEAPEVTAANWRVNLQMTVILLAWERGPLGRAAENIVIRRCHFERHWGFTVHQPGGGRGIEYVENRHTDCMNGVNLNADHILAVRNRFVRAEGFECAESYGWYLDNEFQNVYLAFSIGGNMSDRSAPVARTVTLRRNTVDGVTWLRGADGPTSAIVIADNVEDVVVDENHVVHAAGIGIQVISHDPRLRPTRNVRITRNTLLATGVREDPERPAGRRENLWSRYAIYVDGADDVEISGNTIADRLPGEGPGRFAARAGVLARAGRGRGLRIGRNDIRVEGERYEIIGEYEGLEWIGERR